MASSKKIVLAKVLWPDSYYPFYDWQRKQSRTLSPHSHSISSAEEHHRFINRPRDQGRLSLSNLASFFWRAARPKPECGHKLHPNAPLENFCPVCQVQHCLDLLVAITEAWENVGGPFPANCQGFTNGHDYTRLRKGWRLARLELHNLVDKLEQEAVFESHMDAFNPCASTEDVGTTPLIHDAKEALKYYHKNYKYPLTDPSTAIPDPKWKIEPSDPDSRKNVHFPRQLRDGSTRNNATFERKNAEYRAGRHSASTIAGFENTAFAADTRFLLQQLKVCFTTDLGFKRLANKPHRWPAFEGITGEHPRWEEISEGLSVLMQWRSRRKCAKWVQELESGGTDGVAVIVDGNKIVDLILLSMPKGEERAMMGVVE